MSATQASRLDSERATLSLHPAALGVTSLLPSSCGHTVGRQLRLSAPVFVSLVVGPVAVDV